jgi:hypothetical protein
MAGPLIIATAVAAAAVVPLMGLEYASGFVLAGLALAGTQRLPVRFEQLKGYAMAATRLPARKERRQGGRRDEDNEPLARIKALEEKTDAQGKTLNKALKKIDRHIVGCESSSIKNEADNKKIIEMQGEQSAVLATQSQQLVQIQTVQTELQEILPWMKAQYMSSKWWADIGHSVSRFVWGMVKKNWDSVSGKLLLIGAIAAFGVKTGHEMNWELITRWLSGG